MKSIGTFETNSCGS